MFTIHTPPFAPKVNTTARIEATGLPNRIHCSTGFTELIRRAGKDDWLEPREDKVVAKGLGELTTYFLNIRGDKSSVTSDTGDISSIADDVGNVIWRLK